MRMDLFGMNRSSLPSEGGSEISSSSSSSSNRGGWVVAIECVAGSSKADEWSEEMLQTGDIVEEIRVGGEGAVGRSPFKSGRSGLQKLLHSSYKKGETSVWVRVRRRGGCVVSANSSSSPSSSPSPSPSPSPNDAVVDLHACIVPHEGASAKRNYVLRAIRDPNYAVTFVDRLERDCLHLQGSKSSRVACALSKAQLLDGYVSYAWERNMRESLPIANSSCFLSLLVLPKSADASNTRYNSMEDTLARANAWLNCAQASGVPIVFMNVQTEPMLTKISGETASTTVNAGSLADLSNIVNSSLYGFEDYHGVDIGVVKGVRLWYTPVAGEFPLEIKLMEGDTKLGFSVSRTEEGFIYISSVVDEDDVSLPSTRSDLRELYKEARSASKLLVISRVSNEKVLPWMVSPSGAIRCFDTVSLSQKLSLHRHALRPIQLHLLMWDREIFSPVGSRRVGGTATATANRLPISFQPSMEAENIMANSISLNGEATIDVRENAGEASFRFVDFPI